MLNERDFKKKFGSTLKRLRKKRGMTQGELADKLNYSDKAVSKWERGESVPDSYTLYKIADLFSVSMDDIFSDNEEIKIIEKKSDESYKILRVFIPLIAVIGVLFVASMFFLVMKNVPEWTEFAYYPFLYALPVIAIVLTVFSCLWWGILQSCISVSLIIWSTAFSIYCSVRMETIKYIFLPCVVLQIVCVIAYVFAYIIIKKMKQQNRK